MDAVILVEVVRKLTGSCQPFGSESIDSDRYNNLHTKIAIVGSLLEEIEKAGKLHDRSEASIKRIASMANVYLAELRDHLSGIEYLPKYED